MSFKARLAKMQAQAVEAEENYKPGAFGTPIPDDDYLFKVKATLDETRKDPKRLQVIWCFVVAEGEYEGRQVWDWNIIEDNPVGLNICHSRVDELGYQWPEKEVLEKDGLKFLETIIDDITSRCPSITGRVRTKIEHGKDGVDREKTRLYFREVHDLPTGEVAATVEETSEESTAAEQEAVAESQPGNQALLDFCASQGLEGMTTEMTNDEIIAGLVEGGCTFLLPTLTQEEVDLLESNGGEALITHPAVKVTKKTTTPIKKVAPIVTKKTVTPAKKGKK